MKNCTFEESLGLAEIACANHIFKTTGFKVRIAVNRGDPDCAVFDIGYLCTGEHTVFQAQAYHFRAKLDIYNRSREEVQRSIMTLLRSFPVNADINSSSELREEGNVVLLRVAPQTQAISEITTTDVQQIKDAKPILCFTATVLFDVVFHAPRD